MLQQLELHNFIHFEDKHILNFDQGCYFLIGENNTGKTSLYEAVRRCMSVSKSNGLSGAHDMDKLSYVTCVFDDKDTTVASSMIRIPVTCTPKENVNQVFIKTAYKTSKRQANIDIYVDAVKKSKDGRLVNQSFPSHLLKDFNVKVDDFPSAIQVLFKKHKDHLMPFLDTKSTDKYTVTDCEKLLKDTVDEYIVIIFPFRSISPFQSTATTSKPKKQRTSKQIASEASSRADILRWYLRDSDINQHERDTEEYYFRIITSNSGFQFQIDDKDIISVDNRQLRKRHLDSAPLLLKIPEGIYEAKVLAVLLAVRKFKTVCLDDTERGMHPQMIERVRDFVLPELKHKVVLLITHNPCFLARWNVWNIFLFQRTRNEENEKFEIKSVKALFHKESIKTRAAVDAKETEEKTLQLMTERYCSSLFFAKNILFVEGKSDELLMTQFMQILMKDRVLLKTFVDKSDEQSIDEIQYFLCGFCIIPMHGAPNAYKFNTICQKLNIQHYILLDYDAMCNNIPKGTPGHGNADRFCNALNLNLTSVERRNLNADVTPLENRKMFMWKQHKRDDEKSGKIENAVLTLLETNMPEDSFRSFIKEYKIDKTGKLLLDKNVRYEDIHKVARKCIELSAVDTSSDFNRLVKFFIRWCFEERRKYSW